MSKLNHFLLFDCYCYIEFLNRVGSICHMFLPTLFLGVKVLGFLQTICQMGYSFATTML